MKNLTLENGEWKQRVAPQLTAEERELLTQRGPQPNEAFKALVERIRSESLIAVEPAEAETAQAIYDQHKIEEADLIAADISLPFGKGIINCRVNSEHKQIRF